MPSKEQHCSLLCNSDSSASDDNTTVVSNDSFLAQDMESLVCEIKENLRLSGFKHRSTSSAASRRLSRASPYGCSCSCSRAGEKCVCRKKRLFQPASSTQSEDPYERLQELLRDGSLIKEAVRRLKIGLSPKQRYFYDSDEENLTQKCCDS